MLTASSLERRRKGDNAIWPLTWEARYLGGGSLRQFDHDGRHHSTEIDAARVEKLIAHGHPAQPEIEIPAPLAFEGRAPNQVYVIARNTMSHQVGSSGAWTHDVVRVFGFRYGDRAWEVRFDDALAMRRVLMTPDGEREW